MAAATATTPHVLSAAELDALPGGSAVRYETHPGHVSVAIKVGHIPHNLHSTWRTTDGVTVPGSAALVKYAPVLLVPAGGAS